MCLCVCVLSVAAPCVCVRVFVCHKVIVNECSSLRLGHCHDIIAVMYRLSFNRRRIEMVSIKGMWWIVQRHSIGQLYWNAKRWDWKDSNIHIVHWPLLGKGCVVLFKLMTQGFMTVFHTKVNFQLLHHLTKKWCRPYDTDCQQLEIKTLEIG